MPEPLDERGKAKQDDLNRFGEWVEALNRLLGVTAPEVAERLGVEKGALSMATHGSSGMRPNRLVALTQVYRALSEERGVPLPANWEMHFNLSWFNDERVEGRASETLANLQYTGMFFDRMRRLLMVMAKEIVRLHQENAQLRSDLEREKRRRP